MVPVYVFDCVYCKNVRKDDKYRLICGAYPKGFPEEIVHSIIKPHELKECGNGFKFEEKSEQNLIILPPLLERYFYTQKQKGGH